MSQSNEYRILKAVAALAVGMALLFFADASGAAQVDAEKVQPPQVLIDTGLLALMEQQTQDAKLSWSGMLKAVEPETWPEVEPKLEPGPLPVEAVGLIKEAASATKQGEAYRAIQLLQKAEQLAPDHPQVTRALGLAYADSGNLTRAAAYLWPIAVVQREDAEVLLVLSRHASKAGRLEQVLMYADALRQAKAPEAVVDYELATASARRGYTAAAADRLGRVVEALHDDQDANPGKEPARSQPLRVELEVLRAILPQLHIDRGDLMLQAGDRVGAAEAYAQAQLDDPTARYALLARRVYLALLAEDQGEAVDLILKLLGEEDASSSDAGLVLYLLEQGVPADVLAPRIDGLLAQDGSTLPRLQALSFVADKGVLLARVESWLSQSSVSPEALVRAVSLFTFDDTDPADVQPLAQLLTLITDVLEQSPQQALLHARAAVSAVDAPITLLRAIRSDTFNAEQGWSRQLVAAVAFETTDRRRDALQAYDELLDADESFAAQVLLSVVRLQLALGNSQEAHELLGVPEMTDDWVEFDLSLRAMGSLSKAKAREALVIVDAYIKANGKELPADMLRIELIAQMGQPQEACNLLLRLISSNPNDPSLYRMGLRLAYDHSASFSRPIEAERMSRAFITRLISNLPDSPLAKVAMAQNIRNNPSRLGEAKQMLFDVLELEPDNASALSLLVEIFDATGDEANAGAMHDRYVQAIAPGMSRSLLISDRAVSKGQMQRAVEVLEEALELDEQRVLPGPAMTGDQASRALRHLEAADPDRNTDDLYLAMVRRFPDHPGLNNALGYRWAVQNKNLLQAKAMIQRAVAEDPTNHSLLDSLAWVQYKLGEYEEAKVTQSRALMQLEAYLARQRGRGLLLEDEFLKDIAATTAILNDHMGDILYKLGDQTEALTHWREAMKQEYGEEQIRFDPELRSLDDRLDAKIDALANEQVVPVAEVPGKGAHGPEGHPADLEPGTP